MQMQPTYHGNPPLAITAIAHWATNPTTTNQTANCLIMAPTYQ